ncbi:MAG TPA: type 2 isopentenyl-diphosphate Delta-isomerase [Tissierellia bacterium]|nr:type 2 isopentenyl-diphosphate Delta-isomerase [Tissierellia bacterium]
MKKIEEFNSRKNRKIEHIKFYLKSEHENSTLFEDIYLEHNALPELSFEDINTKTLFLNKKVDYPIMINAITGGTDFSQEINRQLSCVASEFNIPIAVGSQTIALYDEKSRESFKVVRKIMKDGVVIGNLGSTATVEEAKVAIDMIEADALQLHLNVAQELIMNEGDRDFKCILNNIENIVKNINKPLIVKEVGFGISKDVAKRLNDIGVSYIDISGSGGTNFIEIEGIRRDDIDFTDLYSWGIPTALSLIKCIAVNKNLNIIASGGIKSSQDIVKSLCIGASMVGISGEILKRLLEGGYDLAYNYIEGLTHKLKILMLLLGKKDIEELTKTPYKVKGELKELI